MAAITLAYRTAILYDHVAVLTQMLQHVQLQILALWDGWP